MALRTLSVLMGCATLVRGTRQTVHFESSPEGAEFRDASTGQRWTAPTDIALERKRRHSLSVSKDGYESQQVYLRSEVPFAWWFLDAFTLGVSTAIDAILGGLYDLKPERVTVVLEPAQTGAPTEKSGR